MTEAEIVIKHVVACLKNMSGISEIAGNKTYAKCYAVAAEECEGALTGSFGWQLDLQDELKKFREDIKIRYS